MPGWNGDASSLTTIPLTEYLANLKKYATGAPSGQGSLLRPEELAAGGVVLASGQACVVPLPSDFNVCAYSYQGAYDAGDPAVLAIVASAQGTSAQVSLYGAGRACVHECGSRRSRAAAAPQRLVARGTTRAVREYGASGTWHRFRVARATSCAHPVTGHHRPHRDCAALQQGRLRRELGGGARQGGTRAPGQGDGGRSDRRRGRP